MSRQIGEFLEKINEERVLAIIPARSGSKGVPHKNIQLIKGYPLLAYSIAAGLLSKKIDRVIVSTDSEEIARIAIQFGAEVPFLRPKELAGDQSGDIEFVEHTIKYMYENEKCIPEYLVHLRPTTPFREVEILDRAIEVCKKNKDCCSLRSGHRASESPFKWFIKEEHGYFRSICDNLDNESANGGRQCFPDVYIPDGYVDVLKSSYIINNNALHGVKMIAFESPDCVEVDTLEDLEYIRYQIEKKGSGLYEYLRSNYAEGR